MTDDTAEQAPNLEVITDPTLEHGEWYFLQQPPKLKEWWIAPEQSNCERQVWNEDPSSYYPVTKGWLIHVIEKSAYQALFESVQLLEKEQERIQLRLNAEECAKRSLQVEKDRWYSEHQKVLDVKNELLAEVDRVKGKLEVANSVSDGHLNARAKDNAEWIEWRNETLKRIDTLRAENERLKEVEFCLRRDHAEIQFSQTETIIGLKKECDRYRQALEEQTFFHSCGRCVENQKIARKALSDSGSVLTEESSASEPEGRAKEQSE